MARRVFFSFHYDRDIWRACQVRNSWLTKPDRESAGFWDASLWEDAKRRGDAAIKAMIDEGLRNTSVTCVLIGAETWQRDWVKYEITRSLARKNGLLGVHISLLKDAEGNTDRRGPNPFDSLYAVGIGGRQVALSVIYPTHDYVLENGYDNLGAWIEAVAPGK